jgi:serine/threonine protein kinase
MPKRDHNGALPIGTVLGDAYRLVRRLAEGGMSMVYEAEQLRLRKRCAVKVMSRELAANREAFSRFHREAEILSQLAHPHIVQIADFGTAPGGEPYLVMEYLGGEDLSRRLQRVGRLPLPDVVRIIRQVCSALAATHSRGIVHRDLKPANIFLLDVEGEPDFVKIVDFGISKVKNTDTKLTHTSALMGTPHYMAPEQASGRLTAVDHRTDQWALACIAWEMLSGRPPFDDKEITALFYNVVHANPAPLTDRVPSLPPDVEAVLRRALAKRSADRFSSITSCSRALETAAAASPVDRATPTGARITPLTSVTNRKTPERPRLAERFVVLARTLMGGRASAAGELVADPALPAPAAAKSGGWSRVREASRVVVQPAVSERSSDDGPRAGRPVGLSGWSRMTALFTSSPDLSTPTPAERPARRRRLRWVMVGLLAAATTWVLMAPRGPLGPLLPYLTPVPQSLSTSLPPPASAAGAP